MFSTVFADEFAASMDVVLEVELEAGAEEVFCWGTEDVVTGTPLVGAGAELTVAGFSANVPGTSSTTMITPTSLDVEVGMSGAEGPAGCWLP